MGRFAFGGDSTEAIENRRRSRPPVPLNLEESDGYNPFRYLRDEKDALRLVNNLIQATTPKDSHESDPFWTKSETALLQAIILMLWQKAPEYEQNFSMVMRVLEYAEVKEKDEGYVSPLDLLFQAIEQEKPDSVAVRQYRVFKMAAGEMDFATQWPERIPLPRWKPEEEYDHRPD